MKIINFCSSLIEWLGLALSFLFAWVWTVKTDNVDTVDDDHVNDLQDLKVDTDRVPILQNILGGSDFGYWSQSDAEKGIGYLDFDSGSVEPVVGETLTGATSATTGKVIWVDVTGGTWGGGNAAGTVYLGGCSTGCFNNNEDVNGSTGGANMLTVNQPDGAVGTDGIIKNGAFVATAADWNPGDCTLASIAGGQVGNCLEMTRTGGAVQSALQAYITVIGKIYKISFYVKSGTSGNEAFQVYEATGDALITGITTAAWVLYTLTYEATTVAPALILQKNTATAGTMLFDEVTVYEITPCCTAADGVAFDGGGWTKDITLDLYRQHWDAGTLTQDGSFYSLKCVISAANDYINWKYDLRGEGEQLARFHDRTVIIGMWVKTSTVSHFRAHIYEQGGANAATDFHTGGGGWEWLEVPYTFGTTATWLYMQWKFEQPPNIDGSTIVYLSQPMLIFGKGADAIIGEGNYRAKSQEFIYGEVPILSNLYDNITGLSDMAFTDLNLEADSDAKLPKGAKAILIHTGLKDAGSAAAAHVGLELRRDAAFATMSYANIVSGKANGLESHVAGKQGCDIYGDVDIKLSASGAGDLDIDMFEYHGVQIN